MQGMIKISDMLNVMASNDAGGKPIPFSFEAVSSNSREGTGGKRVSYKNAFLLAGGNSSKNSRKNPNNWLNVTRTIQVPGKGRPISVPILLVTKFNEEKTYI